MYCITLPHDKKWTRDNNYILKITLNNYRGTWTIKSGPTSSFSTVICFTEGHAITFLYMKDVETPKNDLHIICFINTYTIPKAAI